MQLVVSALALQVLASQAAVTVTVQESGGDVVATASGSLNVSGAVSCGPINTLALFEFVAADNYAYLTGPAGSVATEVCLGLSFSTAQPLHGAAASFSADSGTGDRFGVDQGGANINVYLPSGYSSGTTINSSSTWTGQTLAGIGLAPGTYLFDYGDDSITFIVGSPPVTPPGGSPSTTAVPFMPWWMLSGLASLLAAMGCISAYRRRGR